MDPRLESVTLLNELLCGHPQLCLDSCDQLVHISLVPSISTPFELVKYIELQSATVTMSNTMCLTQ